MLKEKVIYNTNRIGNAKTQNGGKASHTEAEDKTPMFSEAANFPFEAFEVLFHVRLPVYASRPSQNRAALQTTFNL